LICLPREIGLPFAKKKDMLDSIIKKGIPFGMLMALAGVAVDVYLQGVLDYKFNSLKFVAISVGGGILMGVILHFLSRKGK